MAEDEIKNKGGRPLTILSDEQKIEVKTLAAVLTTDQIADYFGIGRRTFYDIMQRDPEVSAQYKKGKAKAILFAGNKCMNKIKNDDSGALFFFLKTQGGWREVHHLEHTSPDGSMTPTIIERVIIDKASDTDA